MAHSDGAGSHVADAAFSAYIEFEGKHAPAKRSISF
jgi:hypothetical protein